jgi:hypothetical protein
MIIFIIPSIYPWLYSDCDISLWICIYCLKLYLLYLIYTFIHLIKTLLWYSNLFWIDSQPSFLNDWRDGISYFDSAPDYLCNLFDMNTHSNVYSLRSSAKGNLFVPRPNSNFMKWTFHYSGTILWNSLPCIIKDKSLI